MSRGGGDVSSNGVNYINLKTLESGEKTFFAKNPETKQMEYFKRVEGMITGIETKKKTIKPQSGKNIGKEIEIEDLIIHLVENLGGKTKLVFQLYSAFARIVLNSLAGCDNFDKIRFSIYQNKNGYWSISLWDMTTEKGDMIRWKVGIDECKSLTKESFINGQKVNDYSELTTKLLGYIPEINAKLSFNPDEEEEVPQRTAPRQNLEDDDLPF